MSDVQYNLVDFNGTKTITVFADGEAQVATDGHPHWDAIVAAAKNGDANIADLFDVTRTVARRFSRLSTRITAANNRLYHDGTEVNNALSKKILEFMSQDVDDWEPLVKFMEKVFDNPEEHSRVQLFEWLERHAFAINEDGDILGYKTLLTTPVTEDRPHHFESVTSGTNKVVVDDVEYTGRVPQSIGSVVEMARNEVAFDPASGCAAGLHVANFNYAKDFARGYGNSTLALVAVNPRDVVSVPTESNWEKVRVCRYRVVREEKIEDTRIEDQGSLWVENPKTADSIEVGSEVVITGLFYNDVRGNPVGGTDGLADYGVIVGEKAVVKVVAGSTDERLARYNHLVTRSNGDIWVGVECVALVGSEPVAPIAATDWYEDDEDSWDSWDDEDSWGL